MHYAALDAHVLIQIFSTLQAEIAREGYNMGNTLETIEKKREPIPVDVEMQQE